MPIITVIGRGHSGTRAISHTLSQSGVFMGHPLNKSGDLLPPDDMYEACRVLAPHVHWQAVDGPPSTDSAATGVWDWSTLHTIDIPGEFTELINRYLTSVRDSTAERKGWKIPETTLVFPWTVRLFPDIKYIYWIRNPRDCIIGRHKTDDLRDFGIEVPATEDERLRRAISWKYQYDLVKATPKPKHWIEVRFEDFVLRQDETLERLGDYLGLKLAKIPVRTESVGRWKEAEGISYFDFFKPAMLAYHYDVPDMVL
jgi:hypothetical protein